jgi:hypothetical protein
MNKKQPKQSAEEASKAEREKMEAFIADYKEVSQKHGIDIGAALSVTEKGIVPVLKFIFIDKA